MTQEEAIHKIKLASKCEDLFGASTLSKDYHALAFQVHPDKLDSRDDIFKRLQKYYEEAKFKVENNFWDKIWFPEKATLIDDAGAVYRRSQYLYYAGDESLLSVSIQNEILLIAGTLFANYAIQKYLAPLNTTEVVCGTKLTPGIVSHLEKPSYRLSSEKLWSRFPNGLPDIHTAWVVSRLLEFTMLIHHLGYAHLGLNPDNIYLVPETHGILVMQHYHMVPLDQKVQSISAKFKDWYPNSIFTTRLAKPNIDLSLVQRIALYLLGDKSGVGTKLKLNPNTKRAYVDFMLSSHEDAKITYDAYRKLLVDCFGPPKFHKLEL